MYPDNDDEEALPTLTKWPFYLGDAALVGLAITIATLAGWQLGGIQIFACVLAVALGAALLVLPYVIEFQMFAREEKEDRAVEPRLLEKQLERLEANLLEQHDRLKKLESRTSLDDQRYELLVSAIDQKTQVELPDMTALIKRIETIEASGKEAIEAVVVVKNELMDLGVSVKQAVESLDSLQLRMNTLEKLQKKKEASLLKRAIPEKQDTTSKAMSRIIDPQNKSEQSDDNTEADSLKGEDNQAASEVETVPAEKSKATSAAPEISSEIDQLPDDFSVSLGADLMMDDDLLEAEEIAKSKKAATKKAKNTTAKKQKTAPAAEQSATEQSATEQSATVTVEVNKLMGIGNKPFLRGSGSGLSWEKGVEMEFQEIGKWNWAISVPVGKEIEVQIYRNDKDADRKGKHVLESGQTLEIVPEF